jgi:uncharacterized protein YlxW (UPF0749 family)
MNEEIFASRSRLQQEIKELRSQLQPINTTIEQYEKMLLEKQNSLSQNEMQNEIQGIFPSFCPSQSLFSSFMKMT